MSKTQRSNDVGCNKEDIRRKNEPKEEERSAYILVYPSAQKSTEETQSTESTTDDEISSISSISMDSALLREEFNFEQPLEDVSQLEGKKKNHSNVQNGTKSTLVVNNNAKKKTSKKEKRRNRTKSFDAIDELDDKNMKFEKGFHEKRKKSIFLETKLTGMEASSNSLLDMFNALDFCEAKRCDKRSIDSMDMVVFEKFQKVPQKDYRDSNFDAAAAGLPIELETIDKKIQHSQSQHDTKSRQSRKSTKSKKSKISKATRHEDKKAKEYDDAVVTSNPPNFYRNFTFPLKESTPSREPPEQPPIKFRSTRMLMKPDELRSLQSDEISDIESSDFEEEDEDRIFDAKSVKSAKSGVSASITLQRVKEIEELLKPMMDPSDISPHPTPTMAPLARRSFLSRAISTPIIEAFRRSIEKKDPLDEGSEHLLGEIHDRSITPTRQTRPNFTDRLGKRSSDRSLLTKTREISHNKKMNLRGGFTGLEEEDDEQPRRPRSGSAENMGKPRNDATSVGYAWRRRFLTDESGNGSQATKTGILLEDSIHSTKTNRRRGSLGSLGAMVLGAVAPAELSTGVKKRGSTRSLEIQGHLNSIVPTNRRSIRSLGSISLSDDGIETKQPTKSRRRGSVGGLGGPDENEVNHTSQPKRCDLNDYSKLRRSHSTDKPKRRHSGEKTRRSHSSNRDKFGEKKRRSHSTDPDKVRRSHSTDPDISRYNYSTNRDKAGEKTRRSYSTDRDKFGEKTRRSHSTDPDKVRRSHSTDPDISRHSQSIDRDNAREKTRRSHSSDRNIVGEKTRRRHSTDRDKAEDKTRRSHSIDPDKTRRKHSTDQDISRQSHSIDRDISGEKSKRSHSTDREKVKRRHSTDQDIPRQNHPIEQDKSREMIRQSHSIDQGKVRGSHPIDRDISKHSHSIKRDKDIRRGPSGSVAGKEEKGRHHDSFDYDAVVFPEKPSRRGSNGSTAKDRVKRRGSNGSVRKDNKSKRKSDNVYSEVIGNDKPYHRDFEGSHVGDDDRDNQQDRLFTDASVDVFRTDKETPRKGIFPKMADEMLEKRSRNQLSVSKTPVLITSGTKEKRNFISRTFIDRPVTSKSRGEKSPARRSDSSVAAATILPNSNVKKARGRRSSVSLERAQDQRSLSPIMSQLKHIGKF